MTTTNQRMGSSIRTLAAALAFSATVAVAGGAYAFNQAWSPVAVCAMGRGGVRSDSLVPGSSGDIVNVGTAAQSMMCGVGQDEGRATDIDDVIVFYADNNNAAGQHLSCRTVWTDEGMTFLQTNARRFACPTAGGCNFEPANFVGSGHIRMDANHGLAKRTSVECVIPAAVGASRSAVRTISLHQP